MNERHTLISLVLFDTKTKKVVLTKKDSPYHTIEQARTLCTKHKNRYIVEERKILHHYTVPFQADHPS